MADNFIEFGAAGTGSDHVKQLPEIITPQHIDDDELVIEIIFILLCFTLFCFTLFCFTLFCLLCFTLFCFDCLSLTANIIHSCLGGVRSGLN